VRTGSNERLWSIPISYPWESVYAIRDPAVTSLEHEPSAASPRTGRRAGPWHWPVSPAHSRQASSLALPYWVLPPVTSLALDLWGLGRPAYSRDETATLSAAERPFPQLVHMLHNIDAVHGTYYALIWVIVQLAGPGPVATRLPSVIATAVAAAAVFGLGERLVSPRAGLAAGLVFAIMPEIGYWGQSARPYALETALAVIASYLLVRAVQAAASGRTTYLWLLAAYVVGMTVLGYVQFLGLMLAAAHLVLVARTWLRHWSDGKGWRLALGWLAAVVAAFVVADPIIGASLAQRHFGGGPVTFAFIRSLLSLIGTPAMAVVAAMAIVGGVAVSAFRGLALLPRDWPGDMIALCVPWLVFPPLILITEAHRSPLYSRYLLFCAPAAAVLIGSGIAALGWVAGMAVLASFAALAVPRLVTVRAVDGHGGGGIIAADQVIARNLRPGDALLYPAFSEPIQMASPYGMRQLRNVLVGESAIRSGTLGGLWAHFPKVVEREKAARRIWVVEISSGGQLKTTLTPFPRGVDFFREERVWDFNGVRLFLYVR
jgi:mannosyltransferase